MKPRNQCQDYTETASNLSYKEYRQRQYRMEHAYTITVLAVVPVLAAAFIIWGLL